MGEIEWAMWANEQAVVSAACKYDFVAKSTTEVGNAAVTRNVVLV